MFIEKIILGITLAAPIGPVSVAMIDEGLKNGFWSAFKIRIGGAIGNSLCLVIAYIGFTHIDSNSQIIYILSKCGALYLIYRGISSLIKEQDIKLEITPQKISRNNILTGFILSIVNPVSILFWIGIFAANISDQKQYNFYDFISNFYIIAGVLIWGLILSALVSFGNNFLNRNLIINITKVAHILMILFGINYLCR